MPYTTVISFTAGNALPAADLNSNFSNLDYLNAKINQQIQVLGASMLPTVTLGAAYGATELTYRNLRFMDFANSGGKTYAEFGFELPSDYDGGTVTFHVLWTANSTSTNSVVWVVQAVAVTDDESLDVLMGTAVTVTDANKSTAYKLNKTDESSALTIAGTPTAGEWVSFMIHRDSGHASDTLAATARLLAVVITYTRS